MSEFQSITLRLKLGNYTKKIGFYFRILHWVATRKINSVIFSRYGIFLISDRPTLGAKEYVTNTAMCAAIWQYSAYRVGCAQGKWEWGFAT